MTDRYIGRYHITTSHCKKPPIQTPVTLPATPLPKETGWTIDGPLLNRRPNPHKAAFPIRPSPLEPDKSPSPTREPGRRRRVRRRERAMRHGP